MISFQRKLQSVANVNSFLCVYIKQIEVQNLRSLSYDCKATTSTDCIKLGRNGILITKAGVCLNKYYFESVKVLFHITIP